MKSMMTRMKDFFMPQDEFDDDEEIEEVETKQEVLHKHRPPMVAPIQSRVVSMNQGPQMEILNFTMTSYDMTGEISSYIKGRKPIIVNMQNLTPAEVQRAVDYLTGACYALDGTVQRVADNNIFIFAPENVNVTPEQIKQKNIWPAI